MRVFSQIIKYQQKKMWNYRAPLLGLAKSIYYGNSAGTQMSAERLGIDSIWQGRVIHNRWIWDSVFSDWIPAQ